MEGSVQFSEIQYFYKNSTVFLTGATGFVGKLLLEKLLRQCHVKHVYVLIRQKDGVDPETRCSNIFDAALFDPLRRTDPDFYKKVSLIVGDVENPDLGLSDLDRARLIKETNFIFHCAADTSLDSTLKTAVNVNVRGTRDLLNLAKEVDDLKAFVFISTIFSNFPRYEIHEEIYESKMPAEKLIVTLNSLSDLVLLEVQPRILGDWPNSYTFTKHAAENLIKEQGKDVPIAIVRAAHIISAANEPVAGYVEKLCSLPGLAVINALGVNRVNYYKNGALDVIPVDYVVSELIASGWYAGWQKLRKKRGDIASIDVLVYHCTNSQEKPITIDEWIGVTETASREVPSTKMIRLPFTFNTACYYNFRLLTFIFHTFMGFLCDSCLRFAGRNSNILGNFNKLYKLQEQGSPFFFKQWYVSNEHSQKLLKRMSFKDRELFNFDVLTINWELYFSNFARGLRVYVMKDPMSTIAEGRKRLQRKLYVQLISAAVIVVVLYVVSKFILFRVLF